MSKSLSEQLAEVTAELETVKVQAGEFKAAADAANTKLAEATARAEKAEGELTAANENLTKVNASLIQATAEVSRLTAEAKTAQQRAVNIAASVGVPPVAADAGTTSAAADGTDIDSLRVAIARETDPVAKGKLAARIRELKEKAEKA